MKPIVKLYSHRNGKVKCYGPEWGSWYQANRFLKDLEKDYKPDEISVTVGDKTLWGEPEDAIAYAEIAIDRDRVAHDWILDFIQGKDMGV